VKAIFRVCLFIAFLCFAELAMGNTEPKAVIGEIDLREWSFTEQGSLQLSGQWAFHLNQLVDPSQIKNDDIPENLIDFPSIWNDISDSRNAGIGYATYQLRIILANHKDLLAIELPDTYCNYKLWINEKVIAQNGIVATNAEQSRPQWLPQTVTFQSISDTLDLVIHVSNYHHYKGGIREPIYLGLAETMQSRRHSYITFNAILCSGLLFMAFAFAITYFVKKKELALLYFSLLCLTWSIRSAFSYQYLFIRLFPDFLWEAALRIEYITLYFTMIWAILFLSKIFKEDVNTIVKAVLIGGNSIFAFTTLFAPTVFFTQLLPLYLSFCGVLILYAMVVTFQAWVYGRKGAWLVIISILLGIIIFGLDLFAYQVFAPFGPMVFYIGYLIIFSLNGICLLYVSGFIFKSQKDENIMRYEDYFGKETK
jgi:7TM diverse intracellular signalling